MRRIDDFTITFSDDQKPEAKEIVVVNEEEYQKQETKTDKRLRSLYDWAGSATAALIAVFILFTFFARVATVNGPSMQPTLNNGDIVFVVNKSSRFKYGDIVVANLKDEEKSIIKRVIAVGGQTVNIDFDKGIVSVDGIELEENYTSEPTYLKGDVTFPLKVPEGFLFVLGDNRNNSKDSRVASTGLIDERYILGKTNFGIAKRENKSGTAAYYLPKIIK